jgi:hypothetical protein
MLSPDEGPGRPPTPGLHLTKQPSPWYQMYDRIEDEETPSRPTSLDLTTTRDGLYDKTDDWTIELREFS